MSNYMIESYNEKYKNPGRATVGDNMNYLSDSLSHVEINRFRGAGDTVYQVVAKAKTINVITGEKSFVVWARREAGNIADALQKAVDEFKNRTVLGMPVEQNVDDVEVPEHLVENEVDWKSHLKKCHEILESK